MFSFFKTISVKHLSVSLAVLFLGGFAAAEEQSAVQSTEKTTSSRSSISSSVKSKSKTTEDLDSDAVKNTTLSGLTGKKSGWRFLGSLSYTPKIRNDQEDTSDVLLRADYSINKKHRVRVQQYYTKYYNKFKSEDEFRAADTVFAHYYNSSYKPFDTHLTWATSLTAPISYRSRTDDLYTRVTGSLLAPKSFLNKKAIAFFIPYARYHWYKYKTSVSGRRLPIYTLGVSLTGIYFITQKWSLAAVGGYSFEALNSSQYEESPDKRLDYGTYRYDLYLSYQMTNRLSTSLSYSQGARYIQEGRYEMVLFDNENSRYGFDLTYTY